MVQIIRAEENSTEVKRVKSLLKSNLAPDIGVHNFFQLKVNER